MAQVPLAVGVCFARRLRAYAQMALGRKKEKSGAMDGQKRALHALEPVDLRPAAWRRGPRGADGRRIGGLTSNSTPTESTTRRPSGHPRTPEEPWSPVSRSIPLAAERHGPPIVRGYVLYVATAQLIAACPFASKRDPIPAIVPSERLCLTR